MIPYVGKQVRVLEKSEGGQVEFSNEDEQCIAWSPPSVPLKI